MSGQRVILRDARSRAVVRSLLQSAPPCAHVEFSPAVVLDGPQSLSVAMRLLDLAPEKAVVAVSPPKRTIPQNARLWAMISDVSRAKPEGRRHTPEVWKALFMHACGHEVQFEQGLDDMGSPFPVGFRSSRLNKKQMADLITFIRAYGDRHGVVWTEPEEAA